MSLVILITCVCPGFSLGIYFRGHVSPLTLILRDIWSDLGGHLNKNIPENIKILGDMYVPLSKILGDI